MTDEEILEQAKKRYTEAIDAWHDIRLAALDDMKFVAGDQWPDDIKRARDQDQRPSLTFNRLPQTVHQVTNDQRQNRPAIKVSPVDDFADVETAKIRQGLIRHIEHKSSADTVYSTAAKSQVTGGFGFFRVLTEYENPLSFKQTIKLKAIHDPMAAILDPNFTEPDGSDANYGFVEERISKEQYNATYPDSDLAKTSDWETLNTESDDWVDKNSVRIAEYFYKEFKETIICLVGNEDRSISEIIEKDRLGELPPGFQILDERKTVVPSVKWCLLNGVEVLKKTDWMSKWIGIIPVLGEEYIIEGKRHLFSLIRHAKDPQKMFNFHKSNEAETIALAPRAPYIGAAGQFEGFEDEWETANRRNHAFLQYNLVDLNGNPIGAPQRNAFEPPVQAITQAAMLSADEIKATTGVYDAALGAKSNETSGKAIERRRDQAQTSNYHFFDNLNKSIRHAGRIINELIPHIFDTAQAIKILGEEGQEEVIKINQETDYRGEKKFFRFDVGEYDVSIDTGPSFETKRQEAASSMIDFAKAMPQHAGNVADLILQNMDWSGAKEMSERIRKTLPPGLVDDKDKKPIPPEVQAQIQQMDQLVQQLTEKVNQLQAEKEQKLIELESKERIETMKLENQAAIKLAELQSKEAVFMLQQQIAELDARTKMLGFGQPFENQNQNLDLDQEMGPDQSQFLDEQQQLTGELPPGSFMEE